MTRPTTLSIPLLCAALLLGPAPASAAPAKDDQDAPSDIKSDPNFERAVEAYQRGTELYAEAKFEEALAAFQEAATLYASPDFQFNIAKCHERLGNYEEAIRSYEVYLRTAEDISDRALIENSIADLEKRIAERDAAAANANEKPEPEPEPEPEPGKPKGRPLIISGAAILGVGVAVGLGGGLGFGIPVASANSQLGDVLADNPERLTFQEADDLATRARSQQTLELVMIGVGGALAVTGAVLIGVGVAKNKKATSARVRVAPSWASSGAGLTVWGSF